MVKTLLIKVIGKVQGVFFRQSTKEKALALSLCGVVKNLEDGSVEIIVTGEDEKLNELMKWARHGPPDARVTSIESTELPLQQFNDFRIERRP